MKAVLGLLLSAPLALAACGGPGTTGNTAAAAADGSPTNTAEVDAALAQAGAMDADAEAAENASPDDTKVETGR